MNKFNKVNPKQSFPELEEKMLEFWKENKTFEKSIESRENSDEFNFYDGPPFATGTPHYGHILAGTIKDVVPRYQTMKGHKVDRKFGWDTHGLPIENIVEKKLEINGTEDIENKVGVHKFNETCRENAFGYAHEWRKTVERMGRWVDMDNDYKTMDTDFMESVWWVYKSLFDKNLIYEGYRVVPYCPRCHTPLSNFEVNQGYKDKQDKTATVKFKVKGTENKYILAWTTTPWTLMANIGLAVGEDIEYSEIKEEKTGDTLVLAKDRLESYFKNEEDYKIIREYKGSCLAGIEYEPLFPDYKELNEAGQMPKGMQLGENAYKVIIGHHVTTESGTGIVHIAPAFGEDDYQIGKDQKLGFVKHINEKGKTSGLLEDNDVFVFDYNEIALQKIKEQNSAFKIDTYNHSYPHCWRCDTPLIYKAISAWYVKVEEIKEKMIENNEKINWTPEIIKHGRFGTWIENAKDWNISRNRYWGAAIPVWQNKDKTENVCIGSIGELFKKNKEYSQMTKLIFVRHGRTDYNEKGLMDYKDNASLNNIGKAQAEEIAKIFKDENIDAIYSSPLSRCKNTIAPLATNKNIEVKVDENLIEINAPELQDNKFSCKEFKWENGHGGGETIKEVYERVKKSLEKIIEENKGKTVVICSHGDPTFLARMALHDNIDYDTDKYSCGKFLENNPEKNNIDAIFGIEYVNTKTKKAMDIHKHFVDEIFIKPETSKKASNVLLVHGRETVVENKTSWKERIKLLENESIKVTCPQFNPEEDPSYDSWAEVFDKQDFGEIDTVYTSSLGGVMTIKYIIENNIKLDRLVMWAPGKSNTRRKNIDEIHDYLASKDIDLTNNVQEIIVVNSDDDEIIDAKVGEELAYRVGGEYIKLSGFKHSGKEAIPQLMKIVEFGLPLRRVPEVLDCWFESGSMPYASKHFPFEENIVLKNEFFAARHGEALHNVEGIYCGDPKTSEKYPLTEKGEQQADKESKTLNEEFDIIISSPIMRAKQTAEIFQKNLGGELIFDERLTERVYGSFEGKTYKELAEWKKENGNTEIYAPEGMETLNDIFARVSDLLKEVNEKYSGKKIMFVGHGSSIRGLLRFVSKNHIQEPINNAEILRLDNNFKFPADFIAEGLDQTRGWFYTLLILGTALFENTPFMNVIVNGIVLAEDGHKMSKSKQNYPDPALIFDKYGADAMRFYLMNSPVVEGQDFRFAEAGVEEVVKKVILPLWNTYYFFTTYANIDDFSPSEKGNILFMRHGKTATNAINKMSGGEDDSDLNKQGINKAIFEARKFAATGEKIDKIITTCRIRTKKTAEILAKELGYEVVIEECSELNEQMSGKFVGMTHDEIREKYKVTTMDELRTLYKEENGVENIEEFENRVISAFKKIKEENKDKNILIVGHNGTFRCLNRYLNSLSKKEAHFCPSINNSEIVKLPNIIKNNALDKWITSELHKLIKEVSESFDNYKLNEAARPIAKFMDNLTNWYIRRSRKRFWKSENSEDKLEAYNTLYETLVEVSKVIAPLMPFVSDYIFKSLTDKESVHLENFPNYVPGFILEDLNEEMDKTQKIINLGLSWRVNNKIRVRQPLASITIGEKLSEYYKDIIKEELNVKDVIELEDASAIAKKICKPNGRAIGPKFGKDVKFIISEAKSGNFEELEGGKVKVGEFILEEGDFELAFEKSDSSMNIEAGFGMAIAMDDEITPELAEEGIARDLVRFIQEARKEAGYEVSDRITLEISENISDKIGNFTKYIENETLSSIQKVEKVDLEKEVEINSIKGTIKLSK